MNPLFHIAFATDWLTAQTTGEYRMSTRGKTLDEIGFIHASFADQVEIVANAIYRDVTDPLLLLEIDPTKVTAPIRIEPVPGTDMEFPHIYGPLPVAAVIDVRPFPAA